MICVVGEALVDLVVEADGTVTAALGGAPFNTARGIGRLGGEVAFAGVLSRDRFGTMLRDRLVADGVGVGHAPRSDRPTTLAAAELDPDSAATYRFYVDGTSAPALTADDVGALPAAPDVLFTGGLGLVLEPMADSVAGLVDGSPTTTTVVVDVNCRPRVIADRDRYLDRLGRVLGRADIVKVSDEDLGVLFPDADPDTAVARLLALGPAAVVRTGGSGATLVATGAGSREIPVAPAPTAVVDTIGAGDTFGAALIVAWLERACRDADLRDASAVDELSGAVAAAHEAAAIVVTRRGADPPWRGELRADWPA